MVTTSIAGSGSMNAVPSETSETMGPRERRGERKKCCELDLILDVADRHLYEKVSENCKEMCQQLRDNAKD